MTNPDTLLGQGNTPLHERGTQSLSTGFQHRGFPLAVEQHIKRSDGCHAWAGFTDKKGSPVISYGGYRFSAQEWIYEYVNDVHLRGASVGTVCGEEGCVNPEHLENRSVGLVLASPDSANV